MGSPGKMLRGGVAGDYGRSEAGARGCLVIWEHVEFTAMNISGPTLYHPGRGFAKTRGGRGQSRECAETAMSPGL